MRTGGKFRDPLKWTIPKLMSDGGYTPNGDVLFYRQGAVSSRRHRARSYIAVSQETAENVRIGSLF